MLIRHRDVCSNKQPSSNPAAQVANDPPIALIHQLLTTLVTEMGVLKGEMGVLKSLVIGLAKGDSTKGRRQRQPEPVRTKAVDEPFDESPPEYTLSHPNRTYQDDVELARKIKNVRSAQDAFDVIVDLCLDTYLNKDHPENHIVRFYKGKTYMYDPYKKIWSTIEPKEATRRLFEETTTSLFCLLEDEIDLSGEAQEAWDICDRLYDESGTSIHNVCKREILQQMLEMESASKVGT
jgi:hypothetical protein